MPFSVPAILQSMSQNASSQPMMSVNNLYSVMASLSSCSVQIPMLMPPTGLIRGTPASINASVPPQTEAMEVEPFDSMISLVMRISLRHSHHQRDHGVERFHFHDLAGAANGVGIFVQRQHRFDGAL